MRMYLDKPRTRYFIVGHSSPAFLFRYSVVIVFATLLQSYTCIRISTLILRNTFRGFRGGCWVLNWRYFVEGFLEG